MSQDRRAERPESSGPDIDASRPESADAVRSESAASGVADSLDSQGSQDVDAVNARESGLTDEPDESRAAASDEDMAASSSAADPPVSPASGSPASSERGSGPQTGPQEMTFTAHLNELRIRLVRCLIGAFIGFLACYGFAEQLFLLLMEPLLTQLEPSGGALIYTGLPEAFFTHVKVAALAGLFVASPYIFYQIWMFIAPGLYDGERKYIIPIALCSAVCFVTGALFGYFIAFPFGFQFFLGYATDFIKPMPSVKEYFSFSTSMLIAFGVIFELPLFMVFLSSLGVVTYKSLRKYRKYAILGNFVVAAILTPPDVVSQCLMAAPLCLLYEVGIWAAYAFGKKPPEEKPAEDADPETHRA